MNPRSYRVNLNLSPIDFPPIMGLGESSVFFRTEPPHIINNKVVLMITQSYVLLNMGDNTQHEVFTAQSVYEIPTNVIKTREDVYECYNDVNLAMSEAWQYVQTQLPTLPNVSFPNQPIETYQKEIDGVFYLLNSQN